MIYPFLGWTLILGVYLSMFFDLRSLNRHYLDKLLNNMSNFLTYTALSGFYVYSKFQIGFNKLKIKTMNAIHSQPILSEITNRIFMFFYPPKIRSLVPSFSAIKNGNKVNFTELNDYDFVLYSLMDRSHSYENIKIIYDDNINLKAPFTKSNLKFISIGIIFNGKAYAVDLKTDVYNYYLVGNRLTKHFFIYYLKHHLELKEHVSFDDPFTVEIIDHKAHIFKINYGKNKNDYIEFEKDIYEYVKHSH